MKLWLRNLLLLVLMLAASGMAVALRPTHKIAEQGPKVDLEAMIPHAFADWREEKQNSAQIVDPSQLETINRIYSKTLSRTYVNTKGERIMLSIAYGEDQRDSMQTHYPEVCYPAQGFQVLSNEESVITLSKIDLPVRRLQTLLGSQRYEPVSYWTMIGTIPTLSGVKKKFAEMHYGLRGEIPDGLLFRISSIDPDSLHAFELHDAFVRSLSLALQPSVKLRLMGLNE
jgi:EpsI family protein